MKKSEKFLLLILLVFSLACTACNKLPDGYVPKPQKTVVVSTSDNKQKDPNAEASRYRLPKQKSDAKVQVTFALADLNGVSVHTELQEKALKAGYKEILKFATGTRELSEPEPVCYTWSVTSKYHKEPPTGYILRVSENADMSNAAEYSSVKPFKRVYNQKTGTEYYWSVTAIYPDDETYTSDTVSYKTGDRAPRNLKIDGVTNCRDLGGWKTADGKKIKQGMVFRTAKLNFNKKEELLISDDGIREMTEVLKVKTEIDLREDEIRTASALGADIKYINIPMKGTAADNIDTYSEQIRDVFRVFAEKENYPVFVHCSIGTDRTGLIVFILNGFLGVDIDSLYEDYVFSNFGDIGSLREYTTPEKSYVKVISGFPGESFREKCRNYLVSIGLTNEELNRITEILTE